MQNALTRLRTGLVCAVAGVIAVATIAAIRLHAQPAAAPVARAYTPVTQAMLENPSPNDWLMFSRTYDAQRYSPLNQITVGNVSKLEQVWTKDLGKGQIETVPLVHDGVMYVILPGSGVQAMDATTGDVIWEYKRAGAGGRAKALAIFEDVIVWTAPDSNVVGIDAKTGKMRWETKTDTRSHTSGAIVANGLVISGGACSGNRNNCYIAAHDAKTGAEKWRFYTVPAAGEPGADSWNGADLTKVQVSTWGLPGAYDVGRKTLYWGIANPMPDNRSARHNGNADGAFRTTPSDLYSDSTVALDVNTGRLKWYYQHLPGDDWDLDQTNERTLVHVKLNPNPKSVKWINPAIKPGEERDVSVMIAEGGGVSLLDRQTGQFLWATPFPFDTPNFAIADIDPKTGKATINYDIVFKGPGETHTVCFWNTRSYWPTAYSPQTNSLYTSYVDNCREQTSAAAGGRGGSWKVVQRPGGKPSELSGLAKINLSTGDIVRFDVGQAPGQGAMLATAGGVVFHGDISRHFKAFDAETGKQLFDTVVGGNVSVSTITYSVKGKQYIAVMSGDNPKYAELAAQVPPDAKLPAGPTAIYIFALP
ncbi:MAG: PQQ-binding-like beta-propeller repeat protein [Acidobacteriota bacterium]